MYTVACKTNTVSNMKSMYWRVEKQNEEKEEKEEEE